MKKFIIAAGIILIAAALLLIGLTFYFRSQILDGPGMENTVRRPTLAPTEPTITDGGLELQVTDWQNGVLTLRITNTAEEEQYCGEDYRLQRRSGADYEDLQPVREYAWNSIAYVLKPGASQEVTCDLSYFGELEAGDYRLRKSCGTADFTLRME